MTPLAIALALFAQDIPDLATTPAPEPAAAPAPAEDRLPTGAPRDDYQFVAWCYGALRGYLDMHDEVMPEVTRIESQFRKPGTSLKDDLKVYADMQAAQQAAAGAAGGGAAGESPKAEAAPADENVVDADFKEVKDEK